MDSLAMQCLDSVCGRYLSYLLLPMDAGLVWSGLVVVVCRELVLITPQ